MNAINDSFLSSADRGVLRLITAGSVDDGKSTLIGRLLYDSKGVFADQLDAIARAKYKRVAGDGIDFAADGRPGGRARAGHHHRRGLPILLDPGAQVHHRRRAGA